MDIQTIINTPFLRLRVLTFVHFILLGNALMGHWQPQAYVFYNILFMVSLLWSIHCRDSTDAIQTAATINFSSFFFDLISIISFFSRSDGAWSVIFTVINMAFRPFSLILLHKELTDRGGDFVLVNVVTTTNRTQRNYQDIDANATRPGVHQSGSAQSNISNLF